MFRIITIITFMAIATACATTSQPAPEFIDAAKIETCRLACEVQTEIDKKICKNVCQYTGDIALILAKEQIEKKSSPR